MADKVLHAAIAEIRVDNPDGDGQITVGKARNLRVTETHRRGRVTGIGAYTPSELPALEFTGTINVGFYTVNFNKHPMLRDAIIRKTGNTEKFVNTMVLKELGLKLYLQRKVKNTEEFGEDGTDENGIIQTTTEIFATIDECFITSDGFDLSEGQISGRDSTFEYTNPVTYVVEE